MSLPTSSFVVNTLFKMLIGIIIVLVSTTRAHEQDCSLFCNTVLNDPTASLWRPECNCLPSQRKQSSPYAQSIVYPINDESSIYYEPAGSFRSHNLFDRSFFLVNPLKKLVPEKSFNYLHNYNRDTRRSKNSVEPRPDLFRSTKQERKNNVHEIKIETEKFPVYLDIDIHSSKTNDDKTMNTKDLFKHKHLAENSLLECIELNNIIISKRNATKGKPLSNPKFEMYYNFSETELIDIINEKCNKIETFFIKSLDEIKQRQPRKNPFRRFNGENHNVDENPTTNMQELDTQSVSKQIMDLNESANHKENIIATESKNSCHNTTEPTTLYKVSNYVESITTVEPSTATMKYVISPNLKTVKTSETTPQNEANIFLNVKIDEYANQIKNNITSEWGIPHQNATEPATLYKGKKINEITTTVESSTIFLEDFISNPVDLKEINPINLDSKIIAKGDSSYTNLSDESTTQKDENIPFNIHNNKMESVLTQHETSLRDTLFTKEMYQADNCTSSNDSTTALNNTTIKYNSGLNEHDTEKKYVDLTNMSNIIMSDLPLPSTNSILNRSEYLEGEYQIPKILTVELFNNTVLSNVSENETIPNSDYKSDNTQILNNITYIVNETNTNLITKRNNNEKSKPTNLHNQNETRIFKIGNSDSNLNISGRMYFEYGQTYIPAKFTQEANGNIGFVLDGFSLCDKFSKRNNSSKLLMLLCNC